MAPPLRRSGPLDDNDVERLLRGLQIDRSHLLGHQWCDNGPGWQGLLLDDAELLLSLDPDPQVLAGLDVGVIAPSDREGIDFEVRAFFPGNTGMTEDPVTGSLNAALAQWLIGAGIAPDSYIAAQGTAMGRAGRVDIRQEDDGVWVGGRSVTVISGQVSLA
jgi:PhzF family phenazine biosynthesis protein